jgi:hypothetical protein
MSKKSKVKILKKRKLTSNGHSFFCLDEIDLKTEELGGK